MVFIKKYWSQIILLIVVVIFIVLNQLKSNTIIKLNNKELKSKTKFRDSIVKNRDLYIQRKIDSLDSIPKPKPQIIYRPPIYKDRTTEENLKILFE